MPKSHTPFLNKRPRKGLFYEANARGNIEDHEAYMTIIIEGPDWMLFSRDNADGVRFFKWDGWNWRNESGKAWFIYEPGGKWVLPRGYPWPLIEPIEKEKQADAQNKIVLATPSQPSGEFNVNIN